MQEFLHHQKILNTFLIDLRKYLKYVAVNDELLNGVYELLEKYSYKVPIIEFPCGILKKSKKLILER